MLFDDIISARASSCASSDSGTCTAIWSPSKSALNAGADQRMQLDRLAFDQHRLERLDAEAVQGRRAVQQHRMLADDLLEDVPHFRPLRARPGFFAALIVVARPRRCSLAKMKGLNSSSAIFFGRPHSVQAAASGRPR